MQCQKRDSMKAVWKKKRKVEQMRTEIHINMRERENQVSSCVYKDSICLHGWEKEEDRQT